jgi:hypothetical protein
MTVTYSYEQRKPAQRQEAPKQRSELNPAQGSPTAFGADLSSSHASGHPVDLPGAIREKFENAFGSDLSAVKFYRSQAVADAGAQAVTMGEKVVFAPGMLDFSSRSGQTLLGHELSHVVSQQRGEVTGAGFLNDPVLEARADREGAIAAAGQQIAAPTAALSSATAAGASGPMQAKKDIDGMAATYGGLGRASRPANSILNSGIGPDQNAYQHIGETAHNPSWFSKKVKGGTDYVAAAQHGLNSVSKFTDTHYARTNPDVLKDGGTWGATPVASFASGGLGVLSGLMGTYTGFTSMIRSLRNRKAGASKKDAAEGGLQMLAGLGNIGSGGASIAKAVSSTAATALKAGGSLQNLVPGLSIATGGVNALLGLSQLQRASNRKDEIEEQMGNMVPEGPNGTFSDDQKMMLRTMRHGREVQKRNAILGGTKVLGGGLSAIGGVLSLGGVTSAAGLGLGAAGALVNGIGSIYNIWKNRRLRKDAIAQEYGGRSYSEVLKDVRANAGGGKYISRRNAWKIFLKSKTNPNMSEDELYADIRKRRAAHMLHQAAAGDATAAAFIESMGVKPNAQTASGSPTFAEGALDLLAEKLK